MITIRCEVCRGSGKVKGHTCEMCDGDGYIDFGVDEEDNDATNDATNTEGE